MRCCFNIPQCLGKFWFGLLWFIETLIYIATFRTGNTQIDVRLIDIATKWHSCQLIAIVVMHKLNTLMLQRLETVTKYWLSSLRKWCKTLKKKINWYSALDHPTLKALHLDLVKCITPERTPGICSDYTHHCQKSFLTYKFIQKHACSF